MGTGRAGVPVSRPRRPARPGALVPGAVTARGERGPFKSGAAMICLVLGLFAGLFHTGTGWDGILSPEHQGPPFPLCPTARDPHSPGETPRCRPGPGPLSLSPQRPTALPSSAGTCVPPSVPTGCHPPVPALLKAWRLYFPPQSCVLSLQPSAGSMNGPSWPSNRTASSGAWSGRSSAASRGRGCSWWG